MSLVMKILSGFEFNTRKEGRIRQVSILWGEESRDHYDPVVDRLYWSLYFFGCRF